MWLLSHKSIIKNISYVLSYAKNSITFVQEATKSVRKYDTYVICKKEKQMISSGILRSKTSFWRLYSTASEWVNFLLSNLVFIECIYHNLPELLKCKGYLYTQWFSSKISSAVTFRGNRNTYLFIFLKISVLDNSAYWQTKHRNFI